jgi:hypothetical protein
MRESKLLLLCGCLGGAIGLAIGFAHGAAAQAIQFRDRTFEIGGVDLYEHRDLIGGETTKLDPSDWSVFVEAVNGKLVWVGDGWACGVSLVYLPGRANSGTVDCKPERSGTASNWNERKSTGTFQTTARLEGNVLTLHGELHNTHYYTAESCGTLRSSSVTQVTVVQNLKLRIVGETCQVLELSVVDTHDDTGTLNGRSTHDITRTVTKSASPASCKITRRSDPGPPPQPLRDPYVPC